MQRLRISEIHRGNVALGEYGLSGWVKTHRQSKRVSFIELSDGSSVKGLQLVIDPGLAEYAAIAAEISTGASITVSGQLVASPAKGQSHEFQVKSIRLIGAADAEQYPLQKKGHTLEFLRECLHLRPRSNTFGAVFRVRSAAALAIHRFFQERGFVYIQTPIITAADCEGAGEMFRVTTLDLQNPPRCEDGRIDYSQDFFKSEANLTVSGQLEAEIFALALRDVYTFGPTFRAENSNTTRHLAEFWMVEPEMAFCDLDGNIAIADEFIKFVLNTILESCGDDLEFLAKCPWCDEDLLGKLRAVIEKPAQRVDYTEAIQILQASGRSFEFPVEWGKDLQSEHERFLAEDHFGGPVFVVNYPKQIKAFYMKLNDDGRTVRAMDLLVPGLGEIIGGSQREDQLELLMGRINELGLPTEDLWWYLELRKYGSVPHAGFGLGFERLLMYVTGMKNIRDVIACPRYPGYAQF